MNKDADFDIFAALEGLLDEGLTMHGYWDEYGIHHPFNTPELETVKCECGIDATYGKDAHPWMHSTYCPKHKKE